MASKKNKGELMPLEGPGRHNGRLHPKTEKVQDAKELSPARMKKARAEVVKIQTRS
jgi:hypothetical protein